MPPINTVSQVCKEFFIEMVKYHEKTNNITNGGKKTKPLQHQCYVKLNRISDKCIMRYTKKSKPEIKEKENSPPTDLFLQDDDSHSDEALPNLEKRALKLIPKYSKSHTPEKLKPEETAHSSNATEKRRDYSRNKKNEASTAHSPHKRSLLSSTASSRHERCDEVVPKTSQIEKSSDPKQSKVDFPKTGQIGKSSDPKQSKVDIPKTGQIGKSCDTKESSIGILKASQVEKLSGNKQSKKEISRACQTDKYGDTKESNKDILKTPQLEKSDHKPGKEDIPTKTQINRSTQQKRGSEDTSIMPHGLSHKKRKHDSEAQMNQAVSLNPDNPLFAGIDSPGVSENNDLHGGKNGDDSKNAHYKTLKRFLRGSLKNAETQTKRKHQRDRSTSTEPYMGKMYALPLSQVTMLDETLSKDTPTVFQESSHVSQGAKALKFIRKKLRMYKDTLKAEQEEVLEGIRQRYQRQMMAVDNLSDNYEKMYLECIDSMTETDLSSTQEKLTALFKDIRRADKSIRDIQRSDPSQQTTSSSGVSSANVVPVTTEVYINLPVLQSMPMLTNLVGSPGSSQSPCKTTDSNGKSSKQTKTKAPVRQKKDPPKLQPKTPFIGVIAAASVSNFGMRPSEENTQPNQSVHSGSQQVQTTNGHQTRENLQQPQGRTPLIQMGLQNPQIQQQMGLQNAQFQQQSGPQNSQFQQQSGPQNSQIQQQMGLQGQQIQQIIRPRNPQIQPQPPPHNLQMPTHNPQMQQQRPYSNQPPPYYSNQHQPRMNLQVRPMPTYGGYGKVVAVPRNPTSLANTSFNNTTQAPYNVPRLQPIRMKPPYAPGNPQHWNQPMPNLSPIATSTITTTTNSVMSQPVLSPQMCFVCGARAVISCCSICAYCSTQCQSLGRARHEPICQNRGN